MYSYEIKQLLKFKKHLLTDEEYIKILETSPQINYIEYTLVEDKVKLKTDDRYEFNFKVKARNKS